LNPLQLGSTNNFRPSQGVSSSVSRHAQDLSVTSIQQKKDRTAATTSIGRAIQKNSGFGATTSVSHIGEEDQKTSSILHNAPTKRSVYDDEQADEVRDRLRYAHIRQMMRERKADEKLAVQAAQGDKKFGLSLGTGVSFNRIIRGGFNKTFGKMVRKNKATFKNISKQDRQVLGDLIQKHATARVTGTGYSYGDRKRMKIEVENIKKTGKISREDAKDFKKIIDKIN